MKVYVVSEQYAGDFCAVFSTIEKAEEFANKESGSLIIIPATIDGGQWELETI